MAADRRRGLYAAGAITALLTTVAWGTDRTWEPLDVSPDDTSTGSPPRVVEGAPRGPYIVVDRGNNRLLLRSGSEILLDAVVSTGSGVVLHEPGPEGRTWEFATPAGRFRVLDERERPVWVRPDWAFVEAGLPIPERTADRREPGALGEYALGLGDGYLIHGTLYERLLGYSVTHGCIRVGRDDLRALVRRVGPGTPVFIF
ncbi:MAG: L,D-transpeptidase [Gemmatimonadetes bacterium]|nr:L,D-transpeptidase [Gemmatimonadota bacterium]